MAEKNQWYKYFPMDFYHDTAGLTLDQIGAYQMVLNLIYMRQGPVDDNDAFIAGHLRVSTRKWRGFKKVLLDTGKLTLIDGCLSNVRAEKEIENSAKTSRKHREHGRKGARKRAENDATSNENSDLDEARLKHIDKIRIEENKNSDPPVVPLGTDDDVGGGATAPPAKPSTTPKSTRNGRRVPIPGGWDWQPGPQDLEHAGMKGFDDARIAEEADKFRIYHRAQGSRFADWHAAWRKWISLCFDNPASAQTGRRPGGGGLAGGGGGVAAARRLADEFREIDGPDASRTGAAAAQAAEWMADIGLQPDGSRAPAADCPDDDALQPAGGDETAWLVIQGGAAKPG